MNPEKPYKILVVDDEADIAELVHYHLQKNNFSSAYFTNPVLAFDSLEHFQPDLILLDIMMPGLDGLEFLKKLRAKKLTPVILASAKGAEADVILGLELGADDYVLKPFSIKELIARVKAVLRRQTPSEKVSPPSQLEVNVGPVKIHREKHEVSVNAKPMAFTLAEFRILDTLLSKPGRVFTRDQLLEKMNGGDVFVIDRNIDVHIRAIRKKLDEEADFIQTVRGIGYKCRDESSSASL